MIRQAVANLFRRRPPHAEERYFPPFPFFDNNLGPIRWIDADDGGCVEPQRYLEVAAFHACVRVISESIAALPFHLIRQSGETRERAVDHPYYRLVHNRPNAWQSSYEFVETLVGHVATWGNAYALKVYQGGPVVQELWPLHPSFVKPQQLQNNEIVYDYMSNTGDDGRRFRADQIVHVRYLSDNGYLGMVPMALSKGTVQLARAMDLYSQKFWQNDARPGVILETSQPVPKEALDNLRRQWEQLHRGSDNAGRTAVLPGGVSAKQLPGATNDSAQMIEMRTFVVQEIARAMRVPCSLIGENSRSTYSNAEQEALNWANCLVPWCRRVESAFERALLDDMPGYGFMLDLRGQLRGDSAARASYYRELFSLGVLSPSEIRQLEDMPYIDKPGMDDHYIPANNFAPIGTPAAAPDAVPVMEVQPEATPQRSRRTAPRKRKADPDD